MSLEKIGKIWVWIKLFNLLHIIPFEMILQIAVLVSLKTGNFLRNVVFCTLLSKCIEWNWCFYGIIKKLKDIQ